MVANTGTYVDSPIHRFADGDDLSGMPLEKLADLDAVVVRVAGSAVRAIDVETLLAHDVRGKAVLLHTGDGERFGTPEYVVDPAFLTRAGADWLVAEGAVLVGIDAANIDDMTDGERPAHTQLLAAGIPIVEHLRGLEQLPPLGARFTAAPPLVEDFGTFPFAPFASVRASAGLTSVGSPAWVSPCSRPSGRSRGRGAPTTPSGCTTSTRGGRSRAGWATRPRRWSHLDAGPHHDRALGRARRAPRVRRHLGGRAQDRRRGAGHVCCSSSSRAATASTRSAGTSIPTRGGTAMRRSRRAAGSNGPGRTASTRCSRSCTPATTHRWRYAAGSAWTHLGLTSKYYDTELELFRLAAPRRLRWRIRPTESGDEAPDSLGRIVSPYAWRPWPSPSESSDSPTLASRPSSTP